MRLKYIVLSVFMTLSMLCSGIYTNAESLEVSEEIHQNTVQKVPENISNLLQMLEVMNEGEINSQGYITRGFAAEILLRFNKVLEGGVATGEMYSDVPYENIYAYAIETATKCGYFFGTGDGKFSPDDNITQIQMATALLRLSGCWDEYIKSSTEIRELLKHAGSEEYLTYFGLANMLYDFLEINIIKDGDIYSDNQTYIKSSTETVLNHFFDIYKLKGVLTENSLTGLWSGSDIADNRVVISGKDGNAVITTGETDIELMIGRYVEAYYKYNEYEDLSVCVYYDASDSKNQITQIDLFDIDYSQSGDNYIEYYTDSVKKRQVKYNKQTAILYNGIYYSEAQTFLKKINGKEGTVTAIDNNSDGVADVFNIDAYDTFIVNSVVLSNGTIFLKNTNKSLLLNETEYDRISITDENQNKVYVEDFVEGMVLSVAESCAGADKKAIKIFVSEKNINGIVTGIYKDEYNKDVIQLDNMTEYTLLNTVKTPEIGQGVIILLNAFGRVAGIDYSNLGEFAYGIITRVAMDDSLNNGVLIKMITAKNTLEVFNIADKLIVDGETYKDTDKLYKKLNRQENISVGNYKFDAGIYPVRYKLRTDGKLMEIDTTSIGAGENDNTFEFIASGNHMLQNELIVGATFAVKESTPVFKITATADGNDIIESMWFDDTRYTTMSNVKSLMSAGESYNYAAYKVDKNSLFADFVIIYSGWGQSYTDKLFVVEKINEVYDEITGQVLKSVHGAENGVEKDIAVSPLYQDKFEELGLVAGDVIRYRVDGYNHLIKVEGDAAVIKHNADYMEVNNISSGQTSIDQFKKYASSTQMIYGYVLERRDNYIIISVVQAGTTIDGKRSQADMEKDALLLKIPNTVPITVYNPTKGKKVFVATYDEILDYKNSGENCSFIALHYRTARLLEAVVLNNFALYK